MIDTPANTPLDPSVVEGYIDRIYAYAFKRSFTDDEAEDLSQEILLTVLRELPKLRQAERLSLPEGTVTWRLSEARRKLKKECTNMEETALRPVRMHIGIYGSGNYDGHKIPFPSAFINDALSQNILYYCYDQPRTIEELAKLCGVPAYYIEERMDNLVRRNAVILPTKHTYRTDFVIWSDKYGIYCEENAEPALMPVMDKLIEALKDLAKDAESIDYYRAGKSEGELFYLYSILAMEYMREHYGKRPSPLMAEQYDGYRWRYRGSMETGEHPELSININRCSNFGSRGRCSHTVYGNWCGFTIRRMMYDWQINVCEDILLTGTSEDVDSVALTVDGGYIRRREDGTFEVTTPAFTLEQKAALDALAEKHLTPLMEDYTVAVDRFLTGYRKLFHAHLADDAERSCIGTFTSLLTAVLQYAQRNGLIEKPTPNAICDVLLQWKK